MTLIEFVQRFVVHIALAATTWLAVVLGVEFIVPGVVAPFVHLPIVGIGVLVLIGCASLTAPTAGRMGRVLQFAVVIAALACVGLLLWSRIHPLGTSGLVLAGCAVFLVLLTLIVCMRESSFDV